MGDIDSLQRAAVAFGKERYWEQFHDPKNLAMALGSEVGELLGILRWVASERSDEVAAQPDVRDRLSEEIGDVGILLLLLCDRTGISLHTAIEDKLRINAERYPVDAAAGRPERPRYSEAKVEIPE